MPIAKSLSEHFKVVGLDLLNHGRSAHTEQMSIESMAAAIVAWCTEAGWSEVALVGHSLGGKVAMDIALHHPQFVKALVVADIAPIEYPAGHDDIFRALFSVDLEAISSRRDALETLGQYVTDPGIQQFLLKNLYKTADGRFDWRFNLATLHREYDTLRSFPDYSVQYPGPSLFIKGELSKYIRREHETAIEALFPNFSFKMIEGAGHWLHAEKPVAFTRLVERFLLENLH